MESVVNTIFEFFYYGRCVGNRPYRKSIGKAFSEFAGVLKASVEWHSTSETSGSRNEVKYNMNRQPQFKMIKIGVRKDFRGSET